MFEMPSPKRRPSFTNALGWKPGTSGEPRLAARVRGVHVAVEHQARPAAGAAPGAEHVRAALLDLLPLHLQAHRRRASRHQLGHRLLVAGEARRRRSPREAHVDEPLLVDRDRRASSADVRAGPARRTGGSARGGRRPRARASRACSPRRGTPRSRRCSRPGVPAIGLQRSRIASVTCAFAASRPPRSIASATGRDLVLLDLGEVEQRVGRALDVLDLVREVHAGDLARAVAAAGRGRWRRSRRRSCSRRRRPGRGRPCRAWRRSRACSATNAGVVIDGVSSPSPISPPSCLHLRRRRGDVDRRRPSAARAPRAGARARRRSNTCRRRTRSARRRATPRTISTASRIGPSGFVSFGAAIFVLLRKIFEVPKPTMKRSRAGGLLHDARVHRDLHRMARVRRDDPPADRQPLRLARHQRRDDRRGARLHAVLAPPRVGLGEPDRVEARRGRARAPSRASRRAAPSSAASRRSGNGTLPCRPATRRAAATCWSSALSTCSTCWFTIGCSTRWPIDADRARDRHVGGPLHARCRRRPPRA